MMKNIHLMQCRYMHEMPTVMNGIHTNSHCCWEKNITTGSKKDDCTELVNITMPTNLCETGNLKKFLE